MARKKINKSTQKKIERAANRHPVITTVAILLVVVLAVCCLLHYKRVIHIPFLDPIIPQEEEREDIITDDLSIHFLELGVWETGDCTLVKTGNTEILIDAGVSSAAKTLNVSIADYCTDGILEYVIATHAHEDHIGGLYGSKVNGAYNGVLYNYQVETIIYFSGTHKEPYNDKGNRTLYGKFLDAVEYQKETYNTTVCTAIECTKEINGAKSSYAISGDISLNILYQKFYEQPTSGDDENDYSVCTLLTQGNNNYLFTGDLELEGEESLVENNDLPKCQLFKAGHHGSNTSSNKVLLEKIQPEVVCVCCCAGSNEYTEENNNQFPTQDFINRVGKWTDKIYVTTISTSNEKGNRRFASMNGNITVTSNGGEVTVRCSNNDTILKETEWFKQNRTWPADGK